MIAAAGLDYDYAPDAPPPARKRWWAIATAQLVDEIADEPIRARFGLRFDVSGILAKAGTSGSFCLVARPQVRFPFVPGPRPIVRVHITAEGYLANASDLTIPFDVRSVAAPAPPASAVVMTLSSTVGLSAGQELVVGAGIAEEFVRIAALGPGANDVTLIDPLEFGHSVGDDVVPATAPATIIAMRREPVAFKGRVMRTGVAGAPPTLVANASVALADFWSTQRDVRTRPMIAGVPVGEMTKAAPNTFALALRQGMLAWRPVNATAGKANLSLVAGDEKRLLKPASSQMTEVRISDRKNVVLAGVLRLEAGVPERSEIHTVNSIVGLGGVNDPTVVTLDFPVQSDHPPGARVDRLAPLAGALPLKLTDTAAVGDRVLFLDALPAAPASGLRVRSAGMADEYHDFEFYSTKSDGDGYFRLPPIHRIAQVRLDVNDGLTITSFYVDPEYGQAEHWLDLRIT
jgi:hypothetical protein